VGPDDTVELEILPVSASIVTLRGKHDLASRPQIAVALAVARDCGNVLLDLTHTAFIDTTVIDAVLRAAEALAREGMRLELVIPQTAQSMRSLFEAVSVTRLLPVHDTRGAGAASVAPAVAPSVTPGLRIRALVQKIDSCIDQLEAQRRPA
jgi:anti-anti-sigma regulatory factor